MVAGGSVVLSDSVVVWMGVVELPGSSVVVVPASPALVVVSAPVFVVVVLPVPTIRVVAAVVVSSVATESEKVTKSNRLLMSHMHYDFSV